MLEWLDELKTDLGIPLSIQEYGVGEAEFMSKVDNLAIKAFDDQCTGANPRYPLISELRDILVDSYYGRPYVESYERVAVPQGYPSNTSLKSDDSFSFLAHQSENEHEMAAPAKS
jgi:acetaldehyde dehydrogenase/alcohol dehydrogenase